MVGSSGNASERAALEDVGTSNFGLSSRRLAGRVSEAVRA
jgi:hypothetical protein